MNGQKSILPATDPHGSEMTPPPNNEREAAAKKFLAAASLFTPPGLTDSRLGGLFCWLLPCL